MGEYTPANLRSAVDSIRNPFASQTSNQESLVLDAIYDLADLLEGQAEHDREIAEKAWDEACKAVAWVAKNGDPIEAVSHVVINNPYREGATK